MHLLRYEELKMVCDSRGVVLTQRAVCVLELVVISRIVALPIFGLASTQDVSFDCINNDYVTILQMCAKNGTKIDKNSLNLHIQEILKVAVKLTLLIRLPKITGNIMSAICSSYFDAINQKCIKSQSVETIGQLASKHEKELQSIQSLLKHIMETDQ